MPWSRRLRFLHWSVLAVLLMLVTTCRDQPGRVTDPDGEQDQPGGPGGGALVAGAPVVLVGAGDIATCANATDEETAKLLDVTPGVVFTLGDNAYSSGTSAEYSSCYQPTWGRHKDRTRPAPGDRDYKTPAAAGYFGYFGAAAGDPAKGYYSYDHGDWHIIVLNSAIPVSATSPQVAWLVADLAASTKQCTLAYFHHPRFFSQSGTPSSKPKAIWDALYAAGAEVIVNASYRFYERFAPQSPEGQFDPDNGLQQFIVGTGGSGSTSFGTPAPNSEARNSGTRGVLKFTLDASSYSWEFIPMAGKTFRDQGSAACHGEAHPVANPGGPYSSEDVVHFNGSASYDPQGDLPLTYAWDFGDGTTGSGPTPSHTYPSSGVYSVTLTVTDAIGDVSDPASTAVTIANFPPSVQAGPVERGQPGGNVDIDVRFTDPAGAAAAPFSYTIDWGDGTQTSGSVVAEPILASHAYSAPGTFAVQVTVADKNGGAGSDSLTAIIEPAGTPQVLLGAGDIADCSSSNWDEHTARILDTMPGTVFTFGDNAYPDGRAIDYANCYNPTWGRHRDRTYAQIGNHEYDMGNANPTFDYFASAVGPRSKGYYSFDLGDWHIIVLNDNTSFVPIAANSVQDLWLQADLAANTKLCTMAIFHQPRFRSTRDSTASSLKNSSRKIIWDRLYAANADVVVNGHYHQYERFAPQTPDGARDDVRGLREFIVGTGGESSALPTNIAPHSEVQSDAFGIMKFTLHSDHYTWEFIPATGETFTDSGTTACH